MDHKCMALIPIALWSLFLFHAIDDGLSAAQIITLIVSLPLVLAATIFSVVVWLLTVPIFKKRRGS